MKCNRRFTFVVFVLLSLAFASSAQTVIVVPSNAASLGFSTADTRPGGAVSYVVDGTLPGGGVGGLNMTTDGTTAAKAQYLRADLLPLASLTDVSYWAKQNSAPFYGADPAFNIPVCLGGVVGTTCVGFTTLVFEPYQNNGLFPPSPAIVPGLWQFWDVDAGMLWSSRSYSSGSCSVLAGGGGTYFYTLSGLATDCPNAVVGGYGFNVGTFNPSYDVSADLMTINGTTYDFEPYLVATNKDQCKNGGWMNYRRADGSTFKNQGDCVSYVNTGR
jgi:hypothetical protein